MLKKMLKSVLPIALVIAMLFSQSALAATVGVYELNDGIVGGSTAAVKADQTFAVVVDEAVANEMVTVLIYEDAAQGEEEANGAFDDGETILYIWQTNADENGDATFTVSLPVNVTESVKAVAIGTQNNATSTYAATGEFEVVPDVVTYTITWVNEDGTELEKDENVVAGTMPSYDGETPTKEATVEYTYTFAGWTPEVVAATADATYTATFTETKNKYTVTWNVNGTETTEEYEYGATPEFKGSTDKAADAQYTYTFAGWDVTPVAVTGNVTYTATYTEAVNKYTVKFVNDDGSEIKSDVLEYGAAIVKPEDPTKEATAEHTYTFAGWTPEVAATVTGDATYTATYNSTVNEYTIKFVDEDGTELQSGKVAYGETPAYTGETPTKTGDAQYSYTFAGWTTEIVPVMGEATYTAKYSSTINKYTITFVDDDDTVLDTQTLEYGETPVYAGETPAKEATAEYEYTFNGWTVSSVTGDATYKATYTATKRSYTITWIVDDVTETTTVEYGQTPAKADPTKEATAQYTYTFAGWTPAIEAVTGEATYTATFTETVNKYTVTWIVDGATETEEYEYGQTPEKVDPTKAATAQYTYTFAGWTPEITAVTGDATYTATFTETVNEYDVVFVVEGVTVQSGKVAYGETPAYTGETPVKEATAQYTYTFAGWTPAIEAVTGNATYTATFDATVNEYDVTFIVEGVTVQSGKVAYGETPAYTGETPEKEATAEKTYTFAGWTPAIEAVTGDATYTATFTETVNEYTVTWIVDGVSETETYAYGAMPTHADPTKDADEQYTYTFKEWTPAITTVTGDATYTAVFEAVAKTQYFIATFGDDADEIKVAQDAEDKTITLPAANGSKEFAGWKAGETFLPAGAEYELTANVDFAAVYVDFTVTNGAAIRLDPANPGLRFTTTGTKIEDAEYGTLLALDAALESRGLKDKYTIEDIQSFNGTADNKLRCAMVKTNFFYNEPEQPMEYRTVMVIPQTETDPAMYELDWAARSYVTVKYSNNTSKNFYSNIVTRSPQEVAAANKADNYEGCTTDEQKAIIDVYAGTSAN